jgi:fibronectin type 3 domain-containing protein
VPLIFLIAGCGAQLSFQVAHSVDLSGTVSTSPSVMGYNVYRSTSATGPFQKLTTDLISEKFYTDTSVQSGMTYYYAVMAVDSNGVESAYSNVAQATVP